MKSVSNRHELVIQFADGQQIRFSPYHILNANGEIHPFNGNLCHSQVVPKAKIKDFDNLKITQEFPCGTKTIHYIPLNLVNLTAQPQNASSMQNNVPSSGCSHVSDTDFGSMDGNASINSFSTAASGKAYEPSHVSMSEISPHLNTVIASIRFEYEVNNKPSTKGTSREYYDTVPDNLPFKPQRRVDINGCNANEELPTVYEEQIIDLPPTSNTKKRRVTFELPNQASVEDLESAITVVGDPELPPRRNGGNRRNSIASPNNPNNVNPNAETLLEEI